jgi:hypothetical protein
MPCFNMRKLSPTQYAIKCSMEKPGKCQKFVDGNVSTSLLIVGTRSIPM